jgi:hypothetical protein
MKKLTLYVCLCFFIFDIYAMDNEAFMDKVKEIAHCDTQAQEALSVKFCNKNNKKQYALCMAQLSLDRADLYCENFSKRSFQIQSFLYKEAAKASNNENMYQSILQKIQQSEDDRIEQIKKWITDCVDLYKTGKAREAEIAQLKSDIAENERSIQRAKDTNRILKALEANQPKTEVIQYRGGPPITCTTVNNFTSCM